MFYLRTGIMLTVTDNVPAFTHPRQYVVLNFLFGNVSKLILSVEREYYNCDISFCGDKEEDVE